MADYTYPLPDDRIALHPLQERDQSKLLVWRGAALGQDAHFADLPGLLPPDAVLVFNDTKVVPARLVCFRESGARIELFCLEPLAPSSLVEQAMQQTEACVWRCMVGNAKKWKPDEVLRLQGPNGLVLEARQVAEEGRTRQVSFAWTPAEWSFAQVLEALGRVPLPPYLNREEVPADRLRYQTVFAERPGAVAAPTAGLHFTPDVLTKINQKGIESLRVTLHVGAGTFQPVHTENAADHHLHTEEVHVSVGTLRGLARAVGPVVPVGTTALRTIESLYWHGLEVLHQQAEPGYIHLDQWAPFRYDPHALPPANQVLNTLADRLLALGLPLVSGHTGIYLLPGYPFRIANALVTNFHQPGSTLVLLVAGFVGESWRSLYQHALASGYRFLSYGDSSLLWRVG
jgi:S-adenosylmethionine:tRNA ribosyltransferase-isomerase